MEKMSFKIKYSCSNIRIINVFLLQIGGFSYHCGVMTVPCPHPWIDLLLPWAHVGDILLSEAGLWSAHFRPHMGRKGGMSAVMKMQRGTLVDSSGSGVRLRA